MMIGGPPGRVGAGVTRTVVPRYSNGSPLHASRSVSTVSVMRRPRSFDGTPNMANSSAT